MMELALDGAILRAAEKVHQESMRSSPNYNREFGDPDPDAATEKRQRKIWLKTGLTPGNIDKELRQSEGFLHSWWTKATPNPKTRLRYIDRLLTRVQALPPVITKGRNPGPLLRYLAGGAVDLFASGQLARSVRARPRIRLKGSTVAPESKPPNDIPSAAPTEGAASEPIPSDQGTPGSGDKDTKPGE
jgi:hypothetical protein